MTWVMHHRRRGCGVCVVIVIVGDMAEMGMLASFGCTITWKAGICVVWGLGYAKRRYLFRLGVWLCEMGMLASFGCTITRKGGGFASSGVSVMRNEGVCSVWGCGYVKRACWHHLGEQSHGMRGFASSGGSVM